MQAYASAPVGSTVKVMQIRDIIDFELALSGALDKVDNRPIGELNSYEKITRENRDKLSSLFVRRDQEKKLKQKRSFLGISNNPNDVLIFEGAEDEFKSIQLLKVHYMDEVIEKTYPDGMNRKQLEEFIVLKLLKRSVGYTKALNFQALEEELLKWEMPSEGGKGDKEGQFLDLMQSEAGAFAAFKGGYLVDGEQSYRADLKEWLDSARKRAALTALLPFGLTVQRFGRLMEQYEERSEMKGEAGNGEGGNCYILSVCVILSVSD
jgi:hypothetical protein